MRLLLVEDSERLQNLTRRSPLVAILKEPDTGCEKLAADSLRRPLSGTFPIDDCIEAREW